jgi:uncharacterized Zn-finger protein
MGSLDSSSQGNLPYVDVENSFDFASGGDDADASNHDQLFYEFGLSGSGGGEKQRSSSIPIIQLQSSAYQDFEHSQTPANTPVDVTMPVFDCLKSPMLPEGKAVRKRPSKNDPISGIRRDSGGVSIPAPIKVRNPDAGIVGPNGKTRDILYQCPFDSCGKRFTRPYNLKSHYRASHTTERPHACETW